MDYALIVGMSLLAAFWVWAFRASARARTLQSTPALPAAETSAPAAPVEKLPTLYFDVQGVDAEGRRASFTQSVIKLGSDPKAHLRLEGPKVFRMHAVIEAGAGPSVCLIDLGSPGGTLHNGAKIHRATLSHGDVIELGGLRITLGIDAPAAVARVQDAA